MRVGRFVRANWQVARHVGRQDYDDAIDILERKLSGATASPYLELIAHRHLWGKREKHSGRYITNGLRQILGPARVCLFASSPQLLP